MDWIKRCWVLAFLTMITGVSGATQHLAPIRIGMIDGMSGPFANAGEAVIRNLMFAVEQVNARGGVKLPDGRHQLELALFDNKQDVDESLLRFRQLTSQHIPFLVQGNSSAVASALIDAVNKHNARTPDQRVLFLNYSAGDPALTNEKCSSWHFRFEPHADMRMHALTNVIRDDLRVKRVFLIGQDYGFGRQVVRAAREQLAAKRNDIDIAGEVLHPLGKVTDFSPYIEQIRASGADTVITGNWGNDLTLLVKAAKEAGTSLRFYTFYANGLGAPAAIGDAGVGRVHAVTEWHPNVGGSAANRSSDLFYAAFVRRYPDPQHHYVLLRVHVMIEMLVAAIEKARTTEAAAVAQALQGAEFQNSFHHATMRASDHQLIQPLYVAVMQKTGEGLVRFDSEGSGVGFKTERYISEAAMALPTTCRMRRPARW